MISEDENYYKAHQKKRGVRFLGSILDVDSYIVEGLVDGYTSVAVPVLNGPQLSIYGVKVVHPDLQPGQ
jgi:hypothetical protein